MDTSVEASLSQKVMFALVFSQLIEVQAEYHRKSLTLLQAVLPQIKAQQGKCKPPSELGEDSSPPALCWECSCLEELVDLPELVVHQ